ncbi:MAG: hypothetical protein HYV96_12110 [Opitutae bacterium]|nr:hypothetical protein [Opitutae bacterium]
MLKDRLLLAALLIPALLLLVPLVAMRFTAEVKWTGSDFVVAYVVLASAGLAFRFLFRRAADWTTRAAATAAVGSTLFMTWVNMAVGLVGRENHPANALYLGVLAIGILGPLAANFRPRGLARTFFAMAAAQLLVPAIALFAWNVEPVIPVARVFGANAFFAVLFAATALLFRSAAQQQVRAT